MAPWVCHEYLLLFNYFSESFEHNSSSTSALPRSISHLLPTQLHVPFPTLPTPSRQIRAAQNILGCVDHPSEWSGHPFDKLVLGGMLAVSYSQGFLLHCGVCFCFCWAHNQHFCTDFLFFSMVLCLFHWESVDSATFLKFLCMDNKASSSAYLEGSIITDMK